MLLIFIAAAAGEYYIFHDHILVQENNGLLQSFFSQLNALFTLSFCVKLTLIILEGLLLNQLCTQYNIADQSGYSIFSFYVFRI